MGIRLIQVIAWIITAGVMANPYFPIHMWDIRMAFLIAVISIWLDGMRS
jgi:hypothetical protein